MLSKGAFGVLPDAPWFWVRPVQYAYRYECLRGAEPMSTHITPYSQNDLSFYKSSGRRGSPRLFTSSVCSLIQGDDRLPSSFATIHYLDEPNQNAVISEMLPIPKLRVSRVAGINDFPGFCRMLRKQPII